MDEEGGAYKMCVLKSIKTRNIKHGKKIYSIFFYGTIHLLLKRT